MLGFRHDVRELKENVQEIKTMPVETGKILFYGHSYFNRWRESLGHHNLQDDIRGKDGSVVALNHGFGGSSAPELLYYYNDLVKPYAPKVLVINTFTNDPGKMYLGSESANFVAILCDIAIADFPDIKIYCLDAVPYLNMRSWAPDGNSIPARESANRLIKEYCDSRENVTFVEQSKWPMFYSDPKDVGTYQGIREDIYVEDNVHLNDLGYALYKEEFLKFLDAEL